MPTDNALRPAPPVGRNRRNRKAAKLAIEQLTDGNFTTIPGSPGDLTEQRDAEKWLKENAEDDRTYRIIAIKRVVTTKKVVRESVGFFDA